MVAAGLKLVLAVALMDLAAGSVLPRASKTKVVVLDDVKMEPIVPSRFRQRHGRQLDSKWTDVFTDLGGNTNQNNHGYVTQGQGQVQGGATGELLNQANNYNYDENQVTRLLGPPPPRPEGLNWPSGVPMQGQQNVVPIPVNNNNAGTANNVNNANNQQIDQNGQQLATQNGQQADTQNGQQYTTQNGQQADTQNGQQYTTQNGQTYQPDPGQNNQGEGQTNSHAYDYWHQAANQGTGGTSLGSADESFHFPTDMYKTKQPNNPFKYVHRGHDSPDHNWQFFHGQHWIHRR